MLQRIRDNMTGWVSGSIIFIIAIAFIFWGIDFGFFNRDYIALVNGGEVSTNVYRNAVQNQVSQAQRTYQDELPEVLLQQIRNATLENLIRRELLAQRVAERNYRVGDEQLHQSIRSMEAFQVDGVFSLDSYNARLAGVGRSPTSFEAEQRVALQMGQLQDGVAATEFLTSSETRRLIELFEQKREVSVATIFPAQFEDAITVDEAAVQAYYDQNADLYLTPETVTLRYLEIRGADVAADIQVTEDDLLSYYESSKAQLSVTERRQVRHILIEADDEDAALARAQAVTARIRGGEDFAAVAAEASVDSSTAGSGGDLGWVDAETFEGELGDAIFSLAQGEVSDPVRSDFGFHVLRVDAIDGGVMPSFAEVREQLETRYREDQAGERYYSRAETLAERAFENLYELDSAAEALGLKIQEVPGFTRANNEVFPGHPEVAEAAFSISSLEDGENSRVIELGDKHAVVLRVADHKPPQPQPLEAVRETIVQALKKEQSVAMAATAGSELLAALEQGASLEAAARDKNAEFQPARLIDRADREAPAELVAAVFRSAKPEYGPVANSIQMRDGSYAVFTVSQVLPGMPGAVSAEARMAARRAMAQQIGQSTFETYVQDLRDKASISVFEDDTQEAPQQ
ncbi:MAG: peptidyl-prolyl cis-trans isomerase [Chromatiales bacterium]|nr:peptidyl-prolyl cis-trans isomerase [Chromatiales bacterium]